ncbi:FtsW/RodA/SpoVE family cell cycle protein [Pelagibacteraceae bacterium]|nr:FtsW/RodA/SpoVE family cell cycle protein [Pelagibacteraceae bacterium]
MISISLIESSFLKKLIIPLFIISFIFLALVPIIGVEVKGAKRWLNLYFFRLQPIELLKPFFILITVKILTLEKFNNSQVKYFFSFLLLVSILILLIDQPDLGQSILLIVSWIATVFISGVSLIFMSGFISFFFNFIKRSFIFISSKIWIYY